MAKRNIEREYEADIIKRMWLNQMPSTLSGEQLTGDMRNILNAREQAFNAWSPFRPGELGGQVEAHAQGILRNYFSGKPIGEGTVFQRPKEATEEAWKTWDQYARTVDWEHPPTSLFATGGPGPEASVNRVRDFVARQAVGFVGNEQFPGIEPDEAPGIAFLGALENLSTMDFVPVNPEKATEVIFDRINKGMFRALSGYNKTERTRESMEVSFDFGNEFSPSGPPQSLPYQIEHLSDRPAGEVFGSFGSLTPEQDTGARQILERYMGVKREGPLTVGDAYGLYDMMQRTDQSFRDLPTDVQDILHYGSKSRPGGLENVLRPIETDLRGRASGASAEAKALAGTDFRTTVDAFGEPVRTPLPFVSGADPLASTTADQFYLGGLVRPGQAQEVENEDFSMARQSGIEDLSAARREAASSPGVGVYHGPDQPISASAYTKWADHPTYSRQSMSPTQRRMLEEGVDPDAERWSNERTDRLPGQPIPEERGRLPSFLSRGKNQPVEQELPEPNIPSGYVVSGGRLTRSTEVLGPHGFRRTGLGRLQEEVLRQEFLSLESMGDRAYPQNVKADFAAGPERVATVRAALDRVIQSVTRGDVPFSEPELSRSERPLPLRMAVQEREIGESVPLSEEEFSERAAGRLPISYPNRGSRIPPRMSSGGGQPPDEPPVTMAEPDLPKDPSNYQPGGSIGPLTPEAYERNMNTLQMLGFDESGRRRGVTGNRQWYQKRTGASHTQTIGEANPTRGNRRASYIRTVGKSSYIAVEEPGEELGLDMEDEGWNEVPLGIDPRGGGAGQEPPSDLPIGEELPEDDDWRGEFPARENRWRLGGSVEVSVGRERQRAQVLERQLPAFGRQRAREARKGYATVQANRMAQGRRMLPTEKMAAEYQSYIASGESPEQYIEDYSLEGEPEAILAREGEMTPENIARVRRSRFTGVVGDAVALVAESTPGGTNPEGQRGYSLALEAVSRAASETTGHESQHGMMQNVMARARSIMYDKLNEEVKQSGNNIDVAESAKRIQSVAENVLNTAVDIANKTIFSGEEVSASSLGRETREALTLRAGGQAGAVNQLYQQDVAFQKQADAAGGLSTILKRGGVFDRDDGSQVQIRGSDRPYEDSEGGGGGGGYRSMYGPIRAWYAMRAMSGALNMAFWQSGAAMGQAEDFEQALSVQGGTGPGPIQSYMTRQANTQVFGGVAAEQQFGWLMDVPNQLFGDVGGQRMYQAGRFGFGIGMAGYMGNALIGMSGGAPIKGLGEAGLAVGAGYGALALFAELSGREGVGDVLGEAGYQGQRLIGGASALATYGIGSLLGQSDSQISRAIASNPLVQWAGGATPPIDNQVLRDLERQYEGVGDLGLDVTTTAQAGARLSSMFGRETIGYYMPGMQPGYDVTTSFAEAARGAGIEADAFVTSAYQYGMQRTSGTGAQLLQGMWEYAQMEPQQRFEAEQWSGLTQQARGILIQSGLSPETAWGDVQQAYPQVAPGDVSRVTAVAGVSATAQRYGIDYTMTQAKTDLDWMSPEAVQQVGGMAEIFGQQLEGRPYAGLDFRQLMGTISQGYTTKQLGSIGQLVESFAGSGQNLAGISPIVPDYATAGTQTQARVRNLIEMGGQFGVGSQWMNVGQVGGLSAQGYGVFENFLSQAYQGGGADEFSSLFGTGIQTLTGMGTDQLNRTWGITSGLQRYGVSWSDALRRGGSLSTMDNLEYERYQDVYGTALGVGADPMAASRYAQGVIGATGLETRDLSGVLRGDPWSLSRAAEAGMNVPARSIDTGTGLAAWTDPRSGVEYGQADLWGLRDEAHALQYGSQQWSLNQQWSQFNTNQAMQFGGSFIDPRTGQTQNIQYGQFDISDALFDVSVRQQRDAFAYQENQFQSSSRYQREGMQANEEQTETRFQWRMADWEYNENRSELQFAWQMEDFDESIRFARGRDRQRLTRQRDRAVVSESMRSGQSEEQRDRIEQEKEWAEEAQERQRNYFEENFRLQQERLQKDKQYFEERLQWQMRERELSRMSAEIQSHYQRQQLNHQQQILSAEEAIYQKQILVNDARILAQAETEVWLQGIAAWVDAQSKRFENVGSSSILTPPPGGRSISPLGSSGPTLQEANDVGVLREIASTLTGIARKGGGAFVLNMSTPEIKSGVEEATKLYNQTYQVWE